MIPAPESSYTKLSAINAVLLQAGDRLVLSSSDNTAAIKVGQLLRQALTYVNKELPWEDFVTIAKYADGPLYSDSSVFSGVGGLRLSPQYTPTVLSVREGNEYIRYLEWEKLQAHSSSVPHWTMFMGLLFIKPVVQNAVIYYVKHPDVPVVDEDSFAAPDYIVELYIKRTLSMFAARHLGDYDLAEAVNSEYVQDILRYSQSYNIMPTSVRNMQPSSDTKGVPVNE